LRLTKISFLSNTVGGTPIPYAVYFHFPSSPVEMTISAVSYIFGK